MEEIKNVNMENAANEVVEVVTEKLTFKENAMAYGMAGVFGVGLCTIGYYAYKGGKKLAKSINDKRKAKVAAKNGEAVDVDYEEVSEENESK